MGGESRATTEDRAGSFWNANQPGLRFAEAEPGSRAFFAEVEAARYRREAHIPAMLDAERWGGRDVLDAGCGIAIDGAAFARAGARYTGVDQTSRALELARERFAIEELAGEFVQGSILELPFADESFDLVFSHGVIHHVEDTERAVAEFHRVLRPGGTALVMVYHRSSLNYWLTIMGVRRLLAVALLVPGATSLVGRLTGENRETLEGHRALLRRHGLGYVRDRQLFLSNNTDGPLNPLSKAYTRDEARDLFADFADVKVAVRYLNLRIYPGGERLARTPAARRLEDRIGWHLYIEARK